LLSDEDLEDSFGPANQLQKTIAIQNKFNQFNHSGKKQDMLISGTRIDDQPLKYLNQF